MLKLLFTPRGEHSEGPIRGIKYSPFLDQFGFGDTADKTVTEVIPEPSGAAVLIGLCGLTLQIRRRR